MSTATQAPSREGCAVPSKGWAFGNVPVEPSSLVSQCATRLHARLSAAPWSRSSVCFIIDVFALATAFVLAFTLRYEGLPGGSMRDVMWIGLLPVVGLQYGLLARFKVPSASWRFFSIRDLPPILWSLGIAAAVVLAVRYVWGAAVGELRGGSFPMIPASVAIIDASLALLGITGARCVRRLLWQRRRRKSAPGTRTPAILIGAGWTGSLVVQELEANSQLGLAPVAFVDDDMQKVGRMVGRVPVVGTTHDLREVSQKYGADTALITISEATGRAMRHIVQRCKDAGMQPKIVPHIHEIVSGRVRVSQFRDVAIEDLLGRKPVVIDRSVAESAVSGKVALVTGAGGSIGSELCRQILKLKPKTLVLVERSENCLYHVHRELIAREDGSGVDIVPEIADVCDVERMEEVFSAHRPAAVFHAAAHKHVPMMERNPGEAIKNNVFGTKAVADLADRHGVERFILVSTDKAVNPSSVMGATKRIAELYIKDLGGRSAVRFTSVRFGNVMGSNGSVIPLFREQISKGGPVTVTHPEMERFFMTIPEASRLVLEAAGLSKGGEVMLLDMGEPVKIRYLAEQMIKLSGFVPYTDIDIAYTGTRPGEKLFEELALPEENMEETACSKVFVWRGGSPSCPMPSLLSALATPGRTPDEIRATLRRVLPEYRQPQPQQVGSISA
jgi:FlaA1/EpsC-like NDP-sugar epimerase